MIRFLVLFICLSLTFINSLSADIYAAVALYANWTERDIKKHEYNPVLCATFKIMQIQEKTNKKNKKKREYRASQLDVSCSPFPSVSQGYDDIFQFSKQRCTLITQIAKPANTFFFQFDLFLPTHCRGRGLFLHLITLSETQHSVRIPWTRDRPVADACTCAIQNNHGRQKTMPLAGFEPSISESERPQAHTSARFYCISISSCLKGRLKSKIRYKDCSFMRLFPLLTTIYLTFIPMEILVLVYARSSGTRSSRKTRQHCSLRNKD
jgi:hypothetical protein